MANPNDRFDVNAPGSFYIDTSCIDCGRCEDMVPAIFRRFDEDGHNYVHRQPETESEIIQANQALDECPVEAIGNDG